MKTAYAVSAFLLLTAALFAPMVRGADGALPQSRYAYLGEDGKLAYRADEQGNTLPDFSHCGYGGGGVRIPEAPVKATVSPGEGDDGARIQAAIDMVSKMPVDGNGLRGAVLLRRGTYQIAGSLRIAADGVVLRGEGQDENGTVLVATGKEKRTLIVVSGSRRAQEVPESRRKILDDYVPVGGRVFRVERAADLKPGDTVWVRRKGNQAWIHTIGMDRITPRPNNPTNTKQWTPFDLVFDRVVVRVDGDRVTVDAPIACAIEARWGGGELSKYTDAERIRQVGVENLRGVSEFDRGVKAEWHGEEYFADEEHATNLLSINNAVNAWARDLTALHFVGNCVGMGRDAKWVTVQDCTCIEMVSQITGGRRYPFNISGQLCLVLRCRSDRARHAFAVDARVCGPNAFVDCAATNDYADSEPHHRWSVGGLYDNVRARIAIQDRQYMGTGHGWAGANYVVWNCEGSLVCQKPPTAQNWAIGHVGTKRPGAFEREEGAWDSLGTHVQPRSLYLKQLEDRLGRQAVDNITRP